MALRASAARRAVSGISGAEKSWFLLFIVTAAVSAAARTRYILVDVGIVVHCDRTSRVLMVTRLLVVGSLNPASVDTLLREIFERRTDLQVTVQRIWRISALVVADLLNWSSIWKGTHTFARMLIDWNRSRHTWVSLSQETRSISLNMEKSSSSNVICLSFRGVVCDSMLCVV